MGVRDVLFAWIGAPNESARSIREEVHKKAVRRKQIIQRTRERADEAIEESDEGMSFDELAHTIGQKEEASREGDGEDDRTL